MIPPEVLEFYKNKDCLVTGGTGMIGRHVVDILVNHGARVVDASLDWSGLNEGSEHECVDLTDSLFVCLGLTKRMDCVFHVAGLKGSVKATHERPTDFYAPILMMNTNVLEACRVNKVPNVVYVSSIGAYAEAPFDKLQEIFGRQGDPMDYYPGMAKRAGEI